MMRTAESNVTVLRLAYVISTPLIALADQIRVGIVPECNIKHSFASMVGVGALLWKDRIGAVVDRSILSLRSFPAAAFGPNIWPPTAGLASANIGGVLCGLWAPSKSGTNSGPRFCRHWLTCINTLWHNWDCSTKSLAKESAGA
jgi:hypothetical protein